MSRTGKGVSHGAATIVNAIATGKGAAFGIDLRTWAEVSLNDSSQVEVTIEGFAGEPTKLVEKCFRAVSTSSGRGEAGAQDRHPVGDPGVPRAEEQQRRRQRRHHGDAGCAGGDDRADVRHPPGNQVRHRVPACR